MIIIIFLILLLNNFYIALILKALSALQMNTEF